MLREARGELQEFKQMTIRLKNVNGSKLSRRRERDTNSVKLKV